MMKQTLGIYFTHLHLQPKQHLCRNQLHLFSGHTRIYLLVDVQLNTKTVTHDVCLFVYLQHISRKDSYQDSIQEVAQNLKTMFRCLSKFCFQEPHQQCSQFSHNAWRNTDVNDGGIGAVKYPLVADVKHEICQAYDVEHADGVAFRGSFLIDEEGLVRHQVVNDLPLGRNIDEMLRMIDALAFHQEHGEVCPAGWNKGDSGMKDTPEGVAAYLSENADKL